MNSAHLNNIENRVKDKNKIARHISIDPEVAFKIQKMGLNLSELAESAARQVVIEKQGVSPTGSKHVYPDQEDMTPQEQQDVLDWCFPNAYPIEYYCVKILREGKGTKEGPPSLEARKRKIDEQLSLFRDKTWKKAQIRYMYRLAGLDDKDIERLGNWYDHR